MLWWWTWIREGYLERLFMINCPLFGLKLHWFYGPDWDQDCHDHPWWFVSLVLRGSYTERRQTVKHPYMGCDVDQLHKMYLDSEMVTTRKRWSVAFRRAKDIHKIIEVEEGTVTLILNGPRRRSWGFWAPMEPGSGHLSPMRWVPWRLYLGLPPKQKEV